ncbi:MAG: ABC transporter ATP-binding protein [Methanoregula sp.]|nr:ABC transporter ATP-binding protein [Methanoregula sp.]
MIRASRLTKVYYEGRKEIRPLDSTDFSCERGEFILILGHSGCGKTTLLNVIGGLTRPTSGSVIIDGQEILSLPEKEGAKFRSTKIGFVFQFPGLISTLTVLENVLLPKEFTCPSPGDVEKAKLLLDRVGLLDKADNRTFRLSGGQLKRTAIARALINNPSIILADEPTADLDVSTEREVMDLLYEIHKKGTTVIMVTHSPDLASYASRVLTMADGVLSEVQS